MSKGGARLPRLAVLFLNLPSADGEGNNKRGSQGPRCYRLAGGARVTNDAPREEDGSR